MASIMTTNPAGVQAMITDLERAASNTILQLDQRIMRKAADILTALLARAELAEAGRDAIAAVTLERAAAALNAAKPIQAKGRASDGTWWQLGVEDMARAGTAAIRALAPKPPHVAAARLAKIKPLVWNIRNRAGDYKISDGYGTGPKRYLLSRASTQLDWFDTIEEAQAAAQTDHDARTRAALEQGEPT